MKNYKKVVRQLKAEIEKRYPGKPLARHIHSVAEFAREIAKKIGGPDSELARKAYVAGLAHDLYKKLSQEDLRRLIREESVPIDDESWQLGGGLLHAAPAAHFLRTRCGVTDKEILSAVYYHTTSRAGAGVLDKLLYCADYLDPSREIRDSEPDVGVLSERMLTDLDVVYRDILGRKLAHTISRGRPLHSNGTAAWNETVGR